MNIIMTYLMPSISNHLYIIFWRGGEKASLFVWYVFVYAIVTAPYIKVYLMDGKNCSEKQKTSIARRTLDPLYQQQLCFLEPYNGKILQV